MNKYLTVINNNTTRNGAYTLGVETRMYILARYSAMVLYERIIYLNDWMQIIIIDLKNYGKVFFNKLNSIKTLH